MLDVDSASKKGEGPKPSAGKSDEELGLADSLDEDDADAILVSEAELGSPTSGGSTIIGHDETDSLISDMKLSGSSDVVGKSDGEMELAEGSELRLAPGSDVLGGSGTVGSPRRVETKLRTSRGWLLRIPMPRCSPITRCLQAVNSCWMAERISSWRVPAVASSSWSNPPSIWTTPTDVIGDSGDVNDEDVDILRQLKQRRDTQFR